MPLSLEPRWSDGGLAVSEEARVVVMVWRGAPTAARIHAAREAFETIAARSGPLSLLAVVEADSPPPLPQDLPLVVRGFDALGERLLLTAGVLEERIATSAVLEAASLVRSLQRAPRPTKFCADVREACTWLSARHPHGMLPTTFQGALVAQVEATRAALPAV